MTVYPATGQPYLSDLESDLAGATAMLKRHQGLLRGAMAPAAPACPFYPAALLRLLAAVESALEAAHTQTVNEYFVLNRR